MKRFFALLATFSLLLTACGETETIMPENFTYEGGSGEELTHTYSFQYPSADTIRKDVGSAGETISFEDDGILVYQVSTKMIELADVLPQFMDVEATDNMILDGVRAHVYPFPEGMCVEDQCSPPAVVVRFLKGAGPLQQFIFVSFEGPALTEEHLTLLQSFVTEEKPLETEEESVDEA